jgi:hypothetical protein
LEANISELLYPPTMERIIFIPVTSLISAVKHSNSRTVCESLPSRIATKCDFEPISIPAEFGFKQLREEF